MAPGPKAPRLGIHDVLSRIETDERLDAVDGSAAPYAQRLADGRLGPGLRGEWMGHSLHPALTDLPIGCWTSAWFLDILGGKRSRPAAQRLIGIGLLAVIPTALTGAADYASIKDRPKRRVGVAHMVSNSLATVLYAMSWRNRRRGRHARGVALGFVAAGVATVGGYLGGHLAFGENVTPAVADETVATVDAA